MEKSLVFDKNLQDNRANRSVSLDYATHYKVFYLAKAVKMTYSKILGQCVNRGVRCIYEKYGIEMPKLARKMLNRADFLALVGKLR